MKRSVITLFALLAACSLATSAFADGSYQTLPFNQNWNNIALITADDDWSGVPGIIGFRGDALTGATGTDPQTLLADDSPGVVDVNANRIDPNTFITGGLSEFELSDPVVALQGSGTADAPYLLIHINTTGQQNIAVSYLLRDVDGSTDNAAQQFALHYRVGTSGSYTNVGTGYVADASTGPSLTGSVPVSVTLPAAVDNQAQVQLRIMTTNAVGNDEWTGPDDIRITGTAIPVLGACCTATGCSLASQADCAAAGGIYSGDNTVCEPTTCAVSSDRKTWGRIKIRYR